MFGSSALHGGFSPQAGSQDGSFRSSQDDFVVEREAAPARVRAEAAVGSPVNTLLAEHVDVGTTQAVELKNGRQVQVHSQETGHDYAYEHSSEPAVLCLSIWTVMKFLPLPDLQKVLDEEVEELKQNEGKALIEALNAVFKTDTCVIDLESEADTIVCTCGHQCLNHSNIQSSCLRKCPVCRSPITAFFRADGILVDS